MASIISAGTTSGTSLNLSGDTSGVLQLATNGSTTAMTITTGQLVGIGTASPTHRLQVEGNSGAEVKVTRGTNSFVISLSNNIGGDVYVGTSVASALLLQTDNTERMRIDTSGNVGIGTSSPSYNLDVRRTSTGNVVRFTGSTDGGRGLAITSADNGAFLGAIWDYNVASASGIQKWSIDSTERMRLDSSGNLGIGTNSPAAKLDVVTSTANSARLLFTSDAFGQAGIQAVSSSNPSTGIALGLNVGSGNVGIGSSSPGSKLHVDGGSGMSSSGVIARFFGTSGNSLLIRGNGNAENTNGSYGAISDAKLKENIVDATPKLDKVIQLKVRNYNLIGDNLKQIGFVAQEIEQVFPSIVSEIPDLDEEGNDLGTTTKTVKTSVLIPILVKAIQEQQAMIETLQAEVAALKGVN